MLPFAFFQLFGLVDSTVPTTRVFWRTKVGYPEFANDPRSLVECIEEKQGGTNGSEEG